jgi:ubiquinone/menaquinone biosynthesis C-methylase UbiE
VADNTVSFVCPNCKSAYLSSSETVCTKCSVPFQYKKNELRFEYNFKRLAYLKYGKKFLKNAVLNNNGTLSYIELAEGSLSFESRTDVQDFAKFIGRYIPQTNTRLLIDIGCGTLPLPGYLYHNLQLIKETGTQVIGLDPIGNTQFEGFKIHGCSEFIPLGDKSVGIVLLATSLDHVIDVDDTIKEIKRILSDDGYVIVWAGETNLSLANKIKQRLVSLKNYFSGTHKIVEKIDHTYKVEVGNYIIFDNFKIVLKKYPFANDAFHTFYENKEYITRKFRKSGFRLKDYEPYPGMGFYCFQK